MNNGLYISAVALLLLSACGGGEKKKKTLTRNPHPQTVSSDSGKIKNDSVFSDSLTGTKPEIQTVQQYKSAGGVIVDVIHANPTGSSIEYGSVVKINYKGYLPDGKPFDSNELIGMPLPFFVGVGMSVKGWDEALPLIKAGEKARIKVPSKLAYGKKGYGKLIPPDTDLTFDMEIVEKMKPKITASGLEFYKTLEKKGTSPNDSSMVTIHYYGWVKGGKLFDSSHMNGKPYTFHMSSGRAIKGWKECLKMMSPGEKAFVVVPSSLGYGETGIPELVPANATLIYSLELLEVK